MKKDSRYIWYVIDMIIFVAINVAILFYTDIDIETAFSALSWPILFVLALGVYRLTDIVTQESVTEVFRAPFMDKKITNGTETWEMSETGFRGFLGTLTSCNACAGVWVSTVVFYMYIFFPVQTLVFMVIMTLTGFERFFSKVYNFLEKRG